MPARIRHFAIHADDVPRARRFYEGVFGWRFEPWGPPGFFQIREAGLLGALQERREPLTGTGMRGYELTIGVDDLEAAMASIESHGGKVVDPPFRIEGVGELIYVTDTEGNRVGVMQYERDFGDGDGR
jgi:predicted enzyme related to lactoylglutathione lyase